MKNSEEPIGCLLLIILAVGGVVFMLLRLFLWEQLQSPEVWVPVIIMGVPFVLIVSLVIWMFVPWLLFGRPWVEVLKDPRGLIMRPFKKRNEVEQHFKQAKRYANPEKKEFDLKQAIEEFKLAISLKPEEPQYHAGLGYTYLWVPEKAFIRPVNVSFRFSESVNLAIAAFEKAIALRKYYLGAQAIAYMCLGKEEKALRLLTGFKEGWEASLPKENVSLIRQILQVKVSNITLVERFAIDDLEMFVASSLLLASNFELLAAHAKDEPSKFAKLVKEEKLLEREALSTSDYRGVSHIKMPERNPEEARKHLEQAVMYRSQGQHKKVMDELVSARILAPNLAWWYSTLCELVS